MNPATIASSFSIQKISKHHFLIRGDERVRSYMNFRELKWSRTYQGWIVHEDEELDIVQMHVEVLDNVRQCAKQQEKLQKSKKSSKKQREDDDLYERFKRGEEITDDEDDEYEEEEEEEEDNADDYEEDSFVVKDSTDEEVEEWIKEEKKKEKNKGKKVKVIEEPEEESSESEEEEEEGETDPKKKREFQFYKKGILAYGVMSDKQQEKIEAVWNKHLRGWIIRKSYLEKLQKMGWTDIEETPVQPETVIQKEKIVHTPQVVRKEAKPEEKTFTAYKNMLLAKGVFTKELMEQTNAIFHNELGGNLVSESMRNLLIENGFTEKDVVVSIQFSEGKKLSA